MHNNSLGSTFSVTSFGESHGEYVGCVINGVPAGIKLDLAAIQQQVDERKTAKHFFESSRKEDDIVQIISGVYNGFTLGSPITILIKNENQMNADYTHLENVYRPNHADYTYTQKYSIRDHRGGGRSSIRITAPMVAAGEIAKQIIQTKYATNTIAFVSSIGDISLANPSVYFNMTQEIINTNAIKCPDDNTSNQIIQLIEKTKENGDTLGGTICGVIQNLPSGIGEPIFEKLQAKLANAMMSINTVKGFEYGDGFASASQTGSQHNDEFENENNKITTKTNHSGGIQGGISNGNTINFKIALKPISSIAKKQQTINQKGEYIAVEINGRHDVCAVPRAIAIVIAYCNIILADLILQHQITTL